MFLYNLNFAKRIMAQILNTCTIKISRNKTGNVDLKDGMVSFRTDLLKVIFSAIFSEKNHLTLLFIYC